MTDVDSPAEVFALFEVQKAAAIQDAQEMCDTHVRWADHLRECRACPHAEIAGDLAHHERCIEQYGRILHVLNYSVAPVQPSGGAYGSEPGGGAALNQTPVPPNVSEVG